MYNLISCKSYNEQCFQMTKNNINIPPGQLQYKVNKNDIINLATDIIMSSYFDHNNNKWDFISHSKSNLNKLTPNTKTGNANKWKILFGICCKNTLNDSSCLCIKGVLQNKTNLNEYALMTSIDNEEAINVNTKCRLIKSHDINFKICQCKMIAPPIFWHEFKNRLLY